MRNIDIHEAFLNSGVKKWEVAEQLGIADTTFSKRLRKELHANEKEKILQVIREIQASKEKEVD